MQKRNNEYTLRDEIFIAVAVVLVVVTIASLITHLTGDRPEEYDSWLEIIRTILTS